MSLIDSLTAVFGKGRQITDGIVMFGGSPPRKKRYKANCDACNNVRVVGHFEHGGDEFMWCYACANIIYGHEYPSGNLSRRAFHGHCTE